MRATRYALALVLALAGTSARADNPACAQFDNPLAYNDCLARLGPKAGATRGVPEPRGAARPTRGDRKMGAFSAQRTRGRMRMEFTVTPR